MELPNPVYTSGFQHPSIENANVIFQFGKYLSTQDTNQTFNFPISFPHGCVFFQLERCL